ncbi:ParA family protein [Paludisphaera mucosa]|uniref:AAA family ATPase n=1 Tax=Paludisphaera mucosa TaxID=3030827 RepID=A0ABT6FIN2_9BACT|nr:AAA family ATPase [Paludisphaera mucosa]MDG3007364.1 AAA family ATPase [Paludisphaera mucosa]
MILPAGDGGRGRCDGSRSSSSKCGVGKSACAATIAVGMAKRGRRVLPIDADAEEHATRTVTRGHGGGDVGLGEVLLRHAAAIDAIRPTPADGLDVLSAGASLGGANIAPAQELGRATCRLTCSS